MRLRLTAATLLTLLGVAPARLHAQFTGKDRLRGEGMLKNTLDDIRRSFWDPGLKGVPLDSLEQAALVEIRAATSNSQINGIIAKVFFALDDSHTRFIPPGFSTRARFGWEALPIGDSVFVVEVQPRSPADSAGLKVGDRIVAVEGWAVERARWADLLYVMQMLRRQSEIRVTIQRDEEAPVELVIPVILAEGRRFYDLSSLGGGSDWYQLIRESQSRYVGWDSRFMEIGDSVLYWRLRTFAVDPAFIRASLERARGRHTLILDLRDNAGGLVVTLQALVDRIAHADQVGDTVLVVRKRAKREAMTVGRAREGERFGGKVIVLIDAGSMSASEAFADAVQRLERGTVLGDRSAGALTMATGVSHMSSGGASVFYGAVVAVAMLERPDGSRVEGRGVLPDELITPSPEDLRADRDPVLARALQIVGQPYDPAFAYEVAQFRGEWVRK